MEHTSQQIVASKDRQWWIHLYHWGVGHDPIRDTLRDSFQLAMSMTAFELEEVILRCDIVEALLDLLDSKLERLKSLVVREEVAIAQEKEELLAHLWTMLGGNRRQMVGVQAKLGLLQDLGKHHKEAHEIVTSTVETVESLSEDLEQLRTRVAKPAIDGQEIPVEVQLKSIQNGMDALKIGRDHAQERQFGQASRMLRLDKKDSAV